MSHWHRLLLGGPGLVESDRYASFAPHIERDARTLRGIFAGMAALEAQYDRAVAAAQAGRRGYFTPDEDDRVRQMLLSYRNYRLATFSAVWRYVHYPRERDPLVRLKGFILGYAAALMMYGKSLRFIQVCDPHRLVRDKLNEPDARFGVEAGFFDEVVETYCSLRYLLLFRLGDRFWRSQAEAVRRHGLDRDPLLGDFVRQIGTLRARCRRLLWPTLRKRLQYERRSTWRLFFAPLRATGWGAQALLGHAVARMRTTLDYRPAIDAPALDYLARRLRPGDLLLTRTEHKATTALLPGFFGHVAIFAGQPAELERRGLAAHPAVRRAIEASREAAAPRGWVLEAQHAGVVMRPLEEVLACDHALALRPREDEDAARARLARACEHFGKPYDFDFDFNRSSHVVCSELVYRSLHNHGPFRFALVKRMGRYTLTVDDIARQFLADLGESPADWSAVAFLLAGHRGRAIPVDPAAIPDTLARLLDVAPGRPDAAAAGYFCASTAS
ncbi:YiiX/YebB-like N1pC/P60 family cysteine hydrolase [Propionivibrio sp.]|uniref:YiiX/YebB-like N1pC/P60 family cysteine hydrolase n=1 Tax=Propionivibrio sp. TaxID=2212460 RepID=UPI0039E39E48